MSVLCSPTHLKGFPDTPIDNLSIDEEGTVFAAGEYPKVPSIVQNVKLFSGMPKSLDLWEHTKNSSHLAPVCAWTFSKNTGQGSFYGEKYKVQKVSFEPQIRRGSLPNCN